MCVTVGSSPLIRLVVAAALATLAAASPAPAQTMEQRARAATEAARAKTGQSETLLHNYVTPGLSGQPISTIDGQRSFTPNLACRKSATLMEVLVQPSGTGDLGTVRISRDTDFNGALDSVSNLPVPVSGICANGIISCQPGTWNQCHYFHWEADAAALRLAEVEMPELAGCYCINNSCGTNLAWNNLPSVLGDLGGGMVGALTSFDPRIGVAEAITDGPVIRYIGAETTSCASDPALPQTTYRANPNALPGDAFAVSAGNSIFQALSGSVAGTGRAELTKSCTIEREVNVESLTFDDIVGASGAFQSVTSCGADCRRYRIYGLGACGNNPPIYTGTFQARRPERLVSARIVRIAANDWLQVRINGQITTSIGPRSWLTEGIPSGDCSVDREFDSPISIDITSRLREGPVAVGARVRGGNDGREGWIDVEVRVDTSCETGERLVDLCAGLVSDPNCRLESEDVDGVMTFRNGVNTGLRPLPQPRLFGSAACTVQFTRDFFLRKRAYKCLVDTGSGMPEPDLSRGAYIIDHSTETMIADRVRQADGSYAMSTRPFALPDRGSVVACEPVCKTRAPSVNNEAAPAGVMGTQQNDPGSFDTFYHACTGDNVCPAGSGEEIVSACACLDDFPEAVVMMQTVRLAGADLVCTSRQP
jgi:hypothetical protein